MRSKRFTHMAVAAVAVAAFGVACSDDDTNNDQIENNGGTIDPADPGQNQGQNQGQDPLSDPMAPGNTFEDGTNYEGMTPPGDN